MQILTPGHRYVASNFEKPENGQTIQFIEKTQSEQNQLVTVNDGTTNEEVIIILLDRLSFLNAKFPCVENEKAIYHLGIALSALNERTANRKARNVEGKHEA